eukprot:scaffold7865_cov1022-Prasinococcus_capsulatus_cf.AAC.1
MSPYKSQCMRADRFAGACSAPWTWQVLAEGDMLCVRAEDARTASCRRILALRTAWAPRCHSHDRPIRAPGMHILHRRADALVTGGLGSLG